MCFLLIIQKRKFYFSITKPCRDQFEAAVINREPLLKCTYLVSPSTALIETYFLDGLGEDDANEAVKTFLISWRKEEAQRRLKNMKNKKKNKKKTKTERAIAQDKSKNNEKNQGNQRKGRNERNRGNNDRNQGRTDRNQVPYWAVWDQGGNSAGNSSQEFGRGFGRNPDWLQQQPSGYSRSSSQDTGYNSYGNYNSYDNYK